jgi:hypothetical protein
MDIQDGQSHTARVPIGSLLAADSPRLAGENAEHTRALAESGATLPPIIVHRTSLRIIDGMHRLRAAMIRGQRDIEALFFDGNERDAFVLAVKTNVAHGLPLSLADRAAAAVRILRSHPQWSDRMIAKTAGLSPKTVGAIRGRCSTEDNPRLNTRVGHDGRTRPVSSAEGRRIAGEFIANNPDATLRKIAEVAGISPATAHDVRKRMRRGHDSTLPAKSTGEPRDDKIPHKTVLTATPTRSSKSILLNLKRDPSLRFTQAGRILLRLLDAHTIDPEEWLGLIDNVPAHCTSMVADLARECAQAWDYVAVQVERRGRMSAQQLSG